MIELIIAVLIQISSVTGEVTTTTTKQTTDASGQTTITTTTTVDGGTGCWDDND
jgi:hypothetical protein